MCRRAQSPPMYGAVKKDADRRGISRLGLRAGGTTEQQPRSMRLCQRGIAVGVWQACS